METAAPQYVTDIIAIIMPLAIGFLTMPVMDGIKHTLSFVDKQPASVKQGLVAAIAATITVAARLLETTLPTNLMLWEPETVDTLVAALFAIVLKTAKKMKEQPEGAPDGAA